MSITATELKLNLGKYLLLAATEKPSLSWFHLIRIVWTQWIPYLAVSPIP